MRRSSWHEECCRWFLVLLFLLGGVAGSTTVYSQQTDVPSSDWLYGVQQWLPQELDEQALQEFLEELEWTYRHPIDLREVSLEELHRFPLLYPYEADTIKHYLELHPEEDDFTILAFVLGMPKERTELLRPFFRFSSLREAPNGRSVAGELVQRFAYAVPTVPLDPPGEQKVYKQALGTPLQMQTRLALDGRTGWRFAIKGNKRAGEPFFHAFHQEGYPYYSAYFEYRPMRYNGVQLVVGDFSVHYGLGQTVGSQLMHFPLQDPQYWGMRQRPLQGKLGYADNTVLRGVGLHHAPLKWLQYSLFVSAQPISVEFGKGKKQDTITSIPVGPSYVTQRQHDGRFNAWEYIAGGNLEFTYRRVNAGFVLCYDHFSQPIARVPKDSYRLSLGTQRNLRTGAYGSVYLGDWRLWTELTFSRLLWSEGEYPQLSAAAGLLYAPSYTFSVGLQGYYYPELADSRYAQGVASRPQNRTGGRMALRWSPLEGYTLQVSGDYFHYPNGHKMRSTPVDAWKAQGIFSLQPSQCYRFVVGYSYHPYQMVRSALSEATAAVRQLHTLRCDVMVLPWPELELRFYGRYQYSYQVSDQEGRSGFVTTLDVICQASLQ